MATEGIGHNSVDQSGLQIFIERVERLLEEKKGISDDIRDVMAEAKATGFDTKTMRKVIAIRKMDKEKRQMEEELLDTYLSALGLL
jgi:uncharacterized protein (UPF0335 family)